MKYREAFAIGSVCDGVIKCTFATIYDEKGRGMFSLQRSDAIMNIGYKGGYSDNSSWDDVFMTEVSPGLYFGDNTFTLRHYGDADIDGAITFDLPLVIINQISNDRLVPAMLTDQAVDIIVKACQRMKANKIIVWRVWDTTGNGHQAGFRQKAWEQYLSVDLKALNRQVNGNYHYETTSELVILPKYQRLMDILEKREKVYIKPDAFEWNPTDCANATIITTDPTTGEQVTVKLTDRIAEAKKKVQQAKAILATAATTIFL